MFYTETFVFYFLLVIQYFYSEISSDCLFNLPRENVLKLSYPTTRKKAKAGRDNKGVKLIQFLSCFLFVLLQLQY